jgi:hypothetical protein
MGWCGELQSDWDRVESDLGQFKSCVASPDVQHQILELVVTLKLRECDHKHAVDVPRNRSIKTCNSWSNRIFGGDE